MKRQKLLGYFSRSCAFLGGLVGLGISTPFLFNTISDQNWIAAPFLIFITVGNLLVLVLSLCASKVNRLFLYLGGFGLIQGFFIYLARFSLGIYLIPSTVLLLVAALLELIFGVIRFKGNQSLQSIEDPGSQSINQQISVEKLTSSLTSRERQVLIMLIQAQSNQEIARGLFITQNTVRHHVHQILKKLNCSSRAQAAAIGRKEGLYSEVIPVQNSKSNSG
ncbi:MAG: response regulator transcription factor [Anaerolineales bacterium]